MDTLVAKDGSKYYCLGVEKGENPDPNYRDPPLPPPPPDVYGLICSIVPGRAPATSLHRQNIFKGFGILRVFGAQRLLGDCSDKIPQESGLAHNMIAGY